MIKFFQDIIQHTHIIDKSKRFVNRGKFNQYNELNPANFKNFFKRCKVRFNLNRNIKSRDYLTNHIDNYIYKPESKVKISYWKSKKIKFNNFEYIAWEKDRYPFISIHELIERDGIKKWFWKFYLWDKHLEDSWTNKQKKFLSSYFKNNLTDSVLFRNDHKEFLHEWTQLSFTSYANIYSLTSPVNKLSFKVPNKLPKNLILANNNITFFTFDGLSQLQNKFKPIYLLKSNSFKWEFNYIFNSIKEHLFSSFVENTVFYPLKGIECRLNAKNNSIDKVVFRKDKPQGDSISVRINLESVKELSGNFSIWLLDKKMIAYLKSTFQWRNGIVKNLFYLFLIKTFYKTINVMNQNNNSWEYYFTYYSFFNWSRKKIGEESKSFVFFKYIKGGKNISNLFQEKTKSNFDLKKSNNSDNNQIFVIGLSEVNEEIKNNFFNINSNKIWFVECKSFLVTEKINLDIKHLEKLVYNKKSFDKERELFKIPNEQDFKALCLINDAMILNHVYENPVNYLKEWNKKLDLKDFKSQSPIEKINFPKKLLKKVNEKKFNRVSQRGDLFDIFRYFISSIFFFDWDLQQSNSDYLFNFVKTTTTERDILSKNFNKVEDLLFSQMPGSNPILKNSTLIHKIPGNNLYKNDLDLSSSLDNRKIFHAHLKESDTKQVESKLKIKYLLKDLDIDIIFKDLSTTKPPFDLLKTFNGKGNLEVFMEDRSLFHNFYFLKELRINYIISIFKGKFLKLNWKIDLENDWLLTLKQSNFSLRETPLIKLGNIFIASNLLNDNNVVLWPGISLFENRVLNFSWSFFWRIINNVDDISLWSAGSFGGSSLPFTNIQNFWKDLENPMFISSCLKGFAMYFIRYYSSLLITKLNKEYYNKASLKRFLYKQNITIENLIDVEEVIDIDFKNSLRFFTNQSLDILMIFVKKDYQKLWKFLLDILPTKRELLSLSSIYKFNSIWRRLIFNTIWKLKFKFEIPFDNNIYIMTTVILNLFLDVEYNISEKGCEISFVTTTLDLSKTYSFWSNGEYKVDYYSWNKNLEIENNQKLKTSSADFEMSLFDIKVKNDKDDLLIRLIQNSKAKRIDNLKKSILGKFYFKYFR